MNVADQYLDLLGDTLTASLYPESAWRVLAPSEAPSKRLRAALLRALAKRGYSIIRKRPFDAAARSNGEDWPMFGYSMVGKRRLENVRLCLETVHKEGIEGDFVECGVWRGGASMYARAVLNSLGDNRTVWLCDSFEGMPPQRPEDKADPDLIGRIAVSLEEVRENFRRFGLLDDRVKFVKGWFCDSLPRAPIKKISVLRLDGDYYSSTMDALDNLYSKVSPNGFVIVDDYNAFVSCKQAIDDFQEKAGTKFNIVPIDNLAVYFRKPP